MRNYGLKTFPHYTACHCRPKVENSAFLGLKEAKIVLKWPRLIYLTVSGSIRTDKEGLSIRERYETLNIKLIVIVRWCVYVSGIKTLQSTPKSDSALAGRLIRF